METNISQGIHMMYRVLSKTVCDVIKVRKQVQRRREPMCLKSAIEANPNVASQDGGARHTRNVHRVFLEHQLKRKNKT